MYIFSLYIPLNRLQFYVIYKVFDASECTTFQKPNQIGFNVKRLKLSNSTLKLRRIDVSAIFGANTIVHGCTDYLRFSSKLLSIYFIKFLRYSIDTELGLIGM